MRRRDPLIQSVALLNRAVFWFHPLAWWLERELSGLAEDACDGAVLSRGHEPREYAECLLALARSVMNAGGMGEGFCCEIGGAASGTVEGLADHAHQSLQGRHFPGEVIVQCVRWYLPYPWA